MSGGKNCGKVRALAIPRSRLAAVALTIALQVSFLIHSPVSMAGDTNGPGGPVTTFGGVALNACGPCTDPNTWALDPAAGSNIGNGFCGRCSDKNYVRSTGSCAGTHQGPLNCKNATCKNKATYAFRSTPVGGLTYAGCVAVFVIAGGVVTGIIGLGCGGVCVSPAGVLTLGAACIACLAKAATVGGTAACAFSECIENCNFLGPVGFAGAVPCCN